jgi:hypothetical protein
MPDQMEGATITAGIFDGCRLGREAERARFGPALPIAVSVKIERHGLKSGRCGHWRRGAALHNLIDDKLLCRDADGLNHRPPLLSLGSVESA